MTAIQEISLSPGLYLVSTPIGNLRDISLRALDVLGAVDKIVCEDTRVTGKLLTAYGLRKKMIPYNDHNAEKQRPALVKDIANGVRLALVSDAGTPLISDPGYKLLQDCLDLGLPVTSVPGANAPLTALQLSGLPSDKFSFIGFLPPKSAARRKILSQWAEVPGTLILFETGARLCDSLQDMSDVLGDREAAVVRELTKIHEESRRGSLPELVTHYTQAGPPKGEIVIVLGAAPKGTAGEQETDGMLRSALESMSVKDAAAFVAEKSGRSKKELYALALKIKQS